MSTVTRTSSTSSGPLAGALVVVTADRRANELGTALQRRGAQVRHAPSLTIVPHVDDEALARDTHALIANPPDTVVITTGIGFRGWVEAADASGIADDLLAVLRRARIVARGPKARGALQAAGLTADWVAESETTAEITAWLLTEGVAGNRIAVQHHGAGSDGLDDALLAAGATVQSLVVYRWGPPPNPEAVADSTRSAADGEADAVAFTSAPGAAAWLHAAEEVGALEGIVTACRSGILTAAAVGPVTAGPLRDKGIEPLIPERGRLGALVRSLVAHLDWAHGAVQTTAGSLRLRRGAALLDGRVLPLSPSGLAVLRRLVADAGTVVPRETLLTTLPGTSADPHAAEVAIARLREGLGHKDLITTVVKRGYLLRTIP
ncbi:MAG: uroporphyrinogen-III synthase [Actinomycetota bacterium]